MIGLAQGQVNCSLLNVTDVVIDNINMSIDIAVYKKDQTKLSYLKCLSTSDEDYKKISFNENFSRIFYRNFFFLVSTVYQNRTK